MFRVKNKKTKEIIQVLDTYFDPLYQTTYFFIWENNGWRWRPSKNYVPPNIDLKED